jgi:hypothetical protein
MNEFYGVYQAIVTNNNDPEGFNRIKVIVPQVFGNSTTESDWAWPNLPLGYLPNTGDVVWIMFQGGDTEHPVWTGSLNNFPTPGPSGNVLTSTGNDSWESLPPATPPPPVTSSGAPFAATFTLQRFEGASVLVNFGETGISQTTGTYTAELPQLDNSTGGELYGNFYLQTADSIPVTFAVQVQVFSLDSSNTLNVVFNPITLSATDGVYTLQVSDIEVSTGDGDELSVPGSGDFSISSSTGDTFSVITTMILSGGSPPGFGSRGAQGYQGASGSSGGGVLYVPYALIGTGPGVSGIEQTAYAIGVTGALVFSLPPVSCAIPVRGYDVNDWPFLVGQLYTGGDPTPISFDNCTVYVTNEDSSDSLLISFNSVTAGTPYTLQDSDVFNTEINGTDLSVYPDGPSGGVSIQTASGGDYSVLFNCSTISGG